MPDIEAWLNQDYTEKDVDGELRRLANKANGNEGIPDARYKETRAWGIEPIFQVMCIIKNGQEIPPTWPNGTIVYIFKSKG